MKILDGGFGRELARRGAPFRQPEWSALALTEAPEIVKQVHLDFIDAGAEVITTNNYAVVPFHIGQERFDHEVRDLVQVAIDQAKMRLLKVVERFHWQVAFRHYLVLIVQIYSNKIRLKNWHCLLLKHYLHMLIFGYLKPSHVCKK